MYICSIHLLYAMVFEVCVCGGGLMELYLASRQIY